VCCSFALCRRGFTLDTVGGWLFVRSGEYKRPQSLVSCLSLAQQWLLVTIAFRSLCPALQYPLSEYSMCILNLDSSKGALQLVKNVYALDEGNQRGSVKVLNVCI
jgi:hypothetical protein